MKALRTYFVMALIWLVAGLALVACSDKKTNNGGGTACQGQIINGVCTWDPANGGSGGYYGGVYTPNGNITNNSKFRDFNYRLFNTYSYCSYSTPYSCQDIQVKVQKINNTEYYIYLTSNSLGPYYMMSTGIPSTVRLSATKFTYDGDNQVIFEVYYNNPTRYIIAELAMHDGLDETSSYYTLSFKDNTYAAPIANGEMLKGRDY